MYLNVQIENLLVSSKGSLKLIVKLKIYFYSQLSFVTTEIKTDFFYDI